MTFITTCVYIQCVTYVIIYKQSVLYILSYIFICIYLYTLSIQGNRIMHGRPVFWLCDWNFLLKPRFKKYSNCASVKTAGVRFKCHRIFTRMSCAGVIDFFHTTIVQWRYYGIYLFFSYESVKLYSQFVIENVYVTTYRYRNSITNSLCNELFRFMDWEYL